MTHTNETFPIDDWQEYASPVWGELNSPVWWEINQSDTLNARMPKDDESERHICPLQLPVIERCLRLYSNEGDVVFTPFLGIGSEVYQAVKMKRRGIGIELKQAYFDAAVENVKRAESEMGQMSLLEFLN